MEIKHLKAAYQLAEMHHKADPTNEAKKHVYEKALSEYEEAAEAEPVETEKAEPVNDQDKPEPIIKAEQDYSIEELEEKLKQMKAARKEQVEAEKKAAKEATEAAKLAAKAEANGSKTESEESKKNETPS